MSDLSDRQKKILWVVTKEFIDSAQPVGSSNIICRNEDIECSSATIRKELASLEDLGFLTHPHTSAGRIPTDKGYRFYIDNLMKAYRMTAREKALVDQLNNSLENDMNSIMQETLKTVNSISNYATVVKTDNALLSEMSGSIRKQVANSQKESLYLSGLAKMLFEPEFNDVENIRTMAGLLEEKESLGQLLDEYTDPDKVRVNIGEEIKREDMSNYSMVTKKFHFQDEPVGYIGVIGPKRMRYSQVTNTIDTIANMIDDFFDNF